MAHVFVSYASEDRSRIIPLADALEAEGWSVWWDRTIPPGKNFDEVIEEALDAAGCVIVVWTESAVRSRWVKTEAEEGLRRKVFVPVLFDNVQIPLAFRRIQAADLTDWEPGRPTVGYGELLAAVSDLVPLEPDGPDVAELLDRVIDPDRERLGEPRADDPHERRLDSFYERAAKADREEQWPMAVSLWGMLVDAEPGFRDAGIRLERARKQRRAATLATEAEALLAVKDWRTAGDRVTEIKHLVPDFSGIDMLERAVTERTPVGAVPPEPSARSSVSETSTQRRRWPVAAGTLGALIVLVGLVLSIDGDTPSAISTTAGSTTAVSSTGAATTAVATTAADSSPDDFAEPLFLEAEDALLMEPMEVRGDAEASAGAYISSREDGKPSEGLGGTARIEFNIEQTGSFLVWGRVAAGESSPTSSDSFFVSLDGGSEDTWDFFETASPTPDWGWDLISLRCESEDGPGSFSIHYCDPWSILLTPGSHVLSFRTRDAESRLDAILIVEDGSPDRP